MEKGRAPQKFHENWVFRIALGAFILQGAWLLKKIYDPSLSSTSSDDGAAFAVVREMNKELLYQTADEKKWKSAKIQQSLYTRNQVMTPADSTAVLELRDHSLLTLAPNTLMMLEDSQFESTGALTLYIEKGRVFAKSQDQKTKIKTEKGNIHLAENSEVEIRALAPSSSEVNVKSGSARIEGQNHQVVELTQNQMAKFSNLSPLTVETRDPEVDFNKNSFDSHNAGEESPTTDFQRIYVTEESQTIPISWKGPAETIRLRSFGHKQSTEIILPKEQKQTSLHLKPGQYEIQLTTRRGASQTQALEVIQVSILKVFSPLDRDRFRVGSPIKFSWAEEPLAKEYRVEFLDLRTQEKTIEPNLTGYFEKSFSRPGSYQWQIASLDEHGQVISKTPPLKMSVGENFLAAPKLKGLELRAPASKDIPKKLPPKKKSSQNIFQLPWFHWLSWAQRLLGSPAWAVESNVEAIFRWEAVAFAKSYTIEIAKKSDFRNPLIYKKVAKNEFIWLNFEDGIYYWRVAASDDKDELGLFSEPSKVLLRRNEAKDSLDPDSAFSEGVLIRRRADLESYQLPVDTHSENIFKDTPAQSFDEKRFDKKTALDHQGSRSIEDQAQVNLQLLSNDWTLNGADQLKAQMKSAKVSALHFAYEKSIQRDHSLMVDVFYSRSQWKPDSITAIEPSQEIVDSKTQILWGDSTSSLRRGLMISTIPSISQNSNSEVHLKQVFAGGPSFYYDDSISTRWFASYQLGLVAGESSVALASLNNINYKLFITSQSFGFIGLGGNINLYFVDRSFSNAFGLGLNLGLGF